MTAGAPNIQIKQVMGHWEVYINNKFFCSADSLTEAVNEVYSSYKNTEVI